MEIATLGGGCFWCTEAVYEKLNGVNKVVSGYMGGTAADANYQAVCSKGTDHVEVVQVHFDPEVLSYAEVLRIFFTIHDPTTPNRQGNDVGPQYRSVIFTHGADQAAKAKEVLAEAQEVYNGKVVTEVMPAMPFYAAEDYHQGYFERVGARNGYCTAVIAPKVNKFRKQFAHLLKPATAQG